MGKTIGWAIVGTGLLADRRIAPAMEASAAARLVAVVSRDLARAEGFAALHGAPKAYTDLASALDDSDVDAVYVASPNALHAIHTIASLDAGKHVLCEKPMAASVEECERIVEAEQRSNARVGVAFNNRFNPAHEKARQLVAVGTIGRVSLVTAHFCVRSSKAGWRLDPSLSGGGVLMDMAVHVVDLLHYLTGAAVQTACGWLDFGSYGRGLDESVAGLLGLRHADGSPGAGLIAASGARPQFANRIDLHGELGTIAAVATLVSQLGAQPPPNGYLEVILEGRVERLDFPQVDVYLREIDAFSFALLGSEPLPTSASAGLDAQRVIAALQASAASGKMLSL